MEQIVDNAFELGLPGFILLIVLIAITVIIGKMFTIFSKMTEKFDTLTERIADSNKELSNQLIKSAVTQDSILAIMKETMVAVNNNTVRMALLENKMESNNDKLQEISVKTDNTADKMETIHIKMESMHSKMETLISEISDK